MSTVLLVVDMRTNQTGQDPNEIIGWKTKEKKEKIYIMSSKDQGQEGKPKVAESTKECFAHIMQIDSLLTSQHISSHQGNWNPKQNLK
jgi:hypothetical protein